MLREREREEEKASGVKESDASYVCKKAISFSHVSKTESIHHIYLLSAESMLNVMAIKWSNE